MAYHHHHLANEMGMQQYAEQHLGGITPEDLGHSAADGGRPSPPPHLGGGGGPTWLSNAILRQQQGSSSHGYAGGGEGSFLHLQASSGSPTAASGGGAAQWLPRSSFLQRSNSDEEVPGSTDSLIAAAMSHGSAAGGEMGDAEGSAAADGGDGGEHGELGEGSWQSARYKAEILAHPLYEQLLSAHVSCLRVATPVDQLPRIDAQLAQSQQVVAKYSVLSGHGGQMLGDDNKELDQFMEQLQQHVRVHAMEAVMACWELEQNLQKLTGVWWDMWGGNLPILQKLAVRILSQPCSSSACERNWSAFEAAHSKKRNNLAPERLRDLVFIRMNNMMKKTTSKVESEDTIPIDLEKIIAFTDVEKDQTNEDNVDDIDEDGDTDMLVEMKIIGMKMSMPWERAPKTFIG